MPPPPQSPEDEKEDDLFQELYGKLHAMAENQLQRERSGHTLQATALLHEAWLRIPAGGKDGWEGHSHFVATAARAMRRVLIDHARRRHADKRGSGAQRVTLHEEMGLLQKDPIDVLDLEAALKRLERLSERQARIVELRFFGGLSAKEVAEILDVSQRTVEGDWAMARAWLHGELKASGPS